ncbi:hypothetical protein ABVV53_01320 [Novosphingobium sp. RD2P27]|uniref:Exonuclease domain-containing protein n=1 Tax=Novosphingobium kalidii TaxID=3230299 RepID=A0ABV2CWX5_9SPHN
MTAPALIDFEASCLPDYGQSYPIEVALARVDGSSRTWLIRPADAWRFWDWSPEAEALHGISRDLLADEGLPPAQVVAEMRDFAGECHVYADADLDAYWLEVLAHAAGTKPPFSVLYLGEYLLERGYTREQVVSALDAARERLPVEHVARDDASRLALAVKLLMDGETAA